VKGLPGTIQDGGVAFNTTHWSVVAACAWQNGTADAALARLCRDYWPPLYTFVRRGYSSADAQDIVQGFFAHLLKNKAYAKTDRTKGKFRSFLLASLKNYMADVWDRGRALKRGGNYEFLLLDDEIDEVEALYSRETTSTALTDEQQYERSWAAALVTRALEQIRSEFSSGPKAQVFGALKPFLTGGVGLPSHEAVAKNLNMPIETLRSHLSRLRARYRDFLRQEVARTIGPADDVDEELRHLRTILMASC
jgi:RNA polymerase sigma-70 factor (ECF subfamily)